MSLRENMADGRSLALGHLWLAVGFPELRSKIRRARRNCNLRLGASHIPPGETIVGRHGLEIGRFRDSGLEGAHFVNYHDDAMS